MTDIATMIGAAALALTAVGWFTWLAAGALFIGAAHVVERTKGWCK